MLQNIKKVKPEELPKNYRIINVYKVTYEPALVYKCPFCGMKQVVIPDRYVVRAYSRNPQILSTNDPNKIYEPLNIKPPYCPSCHVRMQYVNEDFPVTYIYGKNIKTGKKVTLIVNDFEPDFYIPEQDEHLLKKLPIAYTSRIKRIERGYKGLDNTPLIKLVVRLPTDVHSKREDALPSLRNKFPVTYQADILFHNKVFAEHLSSFIAVPKKKKTISKDDIIRFVEVDISKVPDLHYVVYDIETEYRSGIELAIKGEAKIYSITLYDSIKKQFYIFFNNPDPLTKEDLLEMKKHIKTKIYNYVHNPYCPNCSEIYEDRSLTVCKYCNVPLNVTNDLNPVFSSFLLNTDFELYYSSSETDMLYNFLTALKILNPDVIGGHNTSGFDDEVIRARVQKLLRNPPLKVNHYGYEGILSVDFMTLWAKTQKSANLLSLNYIAHKELKTSKYSYDEDIDWLYNYDLSTLLTYNLIDVALVVGYNEKMKP